MPAGPCVCRFILTQVLLWIFLELPRKGSAKGGGIRDARVKVHPVHWSTPEAQDPETQPHSAPPRWQRFLYRLPLGVANQRKFCARHVVEAAASPSCCALGDARRGSKVAQKGQLPRRWWWINAPCPSPRPEASDTPVGVLGTALYTYQVGFMQPPPRRLCLGDAHGG